MKKNTTCFFGGEGKRSKNYLQGVCVGRGEHIKDFFLSFILRGISNSGNLQEIRQILIIFPPNALGTNIFNVVMLELNWKIFACSNTKNIFFYLSRSQERTQSP